MKRRHLLTLAMVAATAAAPTLAVAQSYPANPVTMTVPFAAGGTTEC